MSAMREIERFFGVKSLALLGLGWLLCLPAVGCSDNKETAADDVEPVVGDGDGDGDSAAAGDNAGDGAGDGATGEVLKGVEAPDTCPGHWENPGGVPSARFWAVAEDAGMGAQFGKTQGNEERGYLEQEFFFTGTEPEYTTRMVVNRPKDMSRFSGTVIVEWYNVSGGMDVPPLWYLSRDYIAREGHVHVGVSAQLIGAIFLTIFDADRYAEMFHPGDEAGANPIFSQVAKAIRTHTELLLGTDCTNVEVVMGVGQSQSCGRLQAYVNNVQPTDQVYDAHMLHSCGARPPDPTVPIFVINTMMESDGTVIDQPNVVEWEVAGCSHNDAHVTNRGNMEIGEVLDLMVECVDPLNDFPSYRVYSAALDWLDRWVRNGERPESGPGLEFENGELKLDEIGNVLGGVRTQDIDVPMARYTLGNQSADPANILSSLACGIGGGAPRLTEEELLALYPTHEEYVEKYKAAADEALSKGYILQEDHDLAIEQAENAPIPN